MGIGFHGLILHCLIFPHLALGLFPLAQSAHPQQQQHVEQRRCTKPVPIQIPECQNTFYNFTGMPNLIGQETQFDARQQLQTFKPLITYKCSSKLSFFLCSVYTPMCDVTTRHLIGPCRPLCEHVKARCAPVLRVFDFQWPAHLNCSQFPVKNVVGGTMCMEGPEDSEESLPLRNTVEAKKPATANAPETMTNNVSTNHGVRKSTPDFDATIATEDKFLNNWIQQINKLRLDDDAALDWTADSVSGMGTKSSSISVLAKSLRHCSHLKKSTYYVFVNRTGRCIPLCRADILFNPEAKAITVVWTSLLAGICGLVTLVTGISHVFDSKLFRLNERPIVYIAICQLFFALGYAVSLGFGREAVTCGRDGDSGRQIRLQEGLDNSICALVFILQYFFSIAASLWWILLTVTWALQTSHARLRLLTTFPSNGQSMHPGKRTCSTDLCLICLPKNDPWTSELHASCHVNEASTGHKCPDHASGDMQTAFVNGFFDLTHDLDGKSACLTCQSPGRVSYFVRDGKLIPATSSGQPSESFGLRDYSYKRVTARHSVCLTREHIIVWLTTGLLTVGVLVSRQVDADELVPICSVGRQHTRAMGTFVIGPQACMLLIGLVMIGLGLVRTWNLAAKMRHSPMRDYVRGGDYPTSDSTVLVNQTLIIHPDTGHTSWPGPVKANGSTNGHVNQSFPASRTAWNPGFPISRLGLFSLLYLIPFLCVTTCDVYEYVNRDRWLRDPDHKDTDPSPMLLFPPKFWRPDQVVGPSPEIFMLRIFMSLVPGFTCCLWMCAIKGCRPWTKLYRSTRCSLKKRVGPNWFSRKKTLAHTQLLADPNLTRKPCHFSADPSHLSTGRHPSQQQQQTTLRDNPAVLLTHPHPYAIYQYSGKSARCEPSEAVGTNSRAGLEKSSRTDWSSSAANCRPFDPCVIATTPVSVSITTETQQHSSATTPGYYSQARVRSTIEPSLSDTFSDESAVPPPLPATSRPSLLPARVADPCVGEPSPLIGHMSGPGMM